jgi:hypothetical protein
MWYCVLSLAERKVGLIKVANLPMPNENGNQSLDSRRNEDGAEDHETSARRIITIHSVKFKKKQEDRKTSHLELCR